MWQEIKSLPYVCYHVCNIKLKRKPTRSGGKIWKDKHESFICKQSLPRVIIQLDGDNIFESKGEPCCFEEDTVLWHLQDKSI